MNYKIKCLLYQKMNADLLSGISFYDIAKKYRKNFRTVKEILFSGKYEIYVPRIPRHEEERGNGNRFNHRNKQLVDFYLSSKNQTATADAFGVSRQRVNQILLRYKVVSKRKKLKLTKSDKIDQRKEKRLNSFVNNIDRWGKTNCWNWKGFIAPNGYGRARSIETGSLEYAHRTSYKYFVGEIADGLYVLHKCNNPQCVNPDHLYLGTAKDNAADREMAQNHKARRIKKEQAKRIKKELKFKSIADVAKKFSYSYTAIQRIKRGLSHKED